jgi:acetyltransferase-like isoleucine patch superfamily enzyme
VLNIDPSAVVSPLADIEDSVRGSRIEIGASVLIDSFVKIKPAGGTGNLVIGARSVINSGCVLYTGNGVSIGRGVLVAANCTFAPVNHEYASRHLPIAEQGFRSSKGGIHVGDDVWISAGCIILDGAVIGNGCVIAAGSIVRGALEPYKVYGGNPLSAIGERR